MCAIKEVKVISDDQTSKECLKQLNQVYLVRLIFCICQDLISSAIVKHSNIIHTSNHTILFAGDKFA